MATPYSGNCENNGEDWKILRKFTEKVIFGKILRTRIVEPPQSMNMAGYDFYDRAKPGPENEERIVKKEAKSFVLSDTSCQKKHSELDDDYVDVDAFDNPVATSQNRFECRISPFVNTSDSSDTEILKSYFSEDVFLKQDDKFTGLHGNFSDIEVKPLFNKRESSGLGYNAESIEQTSKKTKKGKKRKRLIFGNLFKRRPCVIYLMIFELFQKIFQIFEKVGEISTAIHLSFRKQTLGFEKLPEKRSDLPNQNPRRISWVQRAQVYFRSCLEAPNGKLKTTESNEVLHQSDDKTKPVHANSNTSIGPQDSEEKNEITSNEKITGIWEAGRGPSTGSRRRLLLSKIECCFEALHETSNLLETIQFRTSTQQNLKDNEGRETSVDSVLFKNQSKLEAPTGILTKSEVTIKSENFSEGFDENNSEKIKFSEEPSQDNTDAKKENEQKKNDGTLAKSSILKFEKVSENANNLAKNKEETILKELIQSEVSDGKESNERKISNELIGDENDTIEENNEGTTSKKDIQEILTRNTKNEAEIYPELDVDLNNKEEYSDGVIEKNDGKIEYDTTRDNNNEKDDNIVSLPGNEHCEDVIHLPDIKANKFETEYLCFRDIHQLQKKDFIREQDLSFTIRAFNITGEVEVKLFQPRPAANFKDETARLSTFNGIATGISAEYLAKSGFFVSVNGFIQCVSCNVRHDIDGISMVNFRNNQLHDSRCQYAQKPRSSPQEELEDDDVESDGTPSDHSGDPPGQQSTYIPPGDVRKEQYRLSTFENFRITDASFRKGLAQNGFYFTGFFDRVKCFSCARSVEKWQPATDNPGDRKWHKPTCLFFTKNPNSGNIPIRSLLGNLGNFRQPSSTQGQDELLHQRDDRGQIIRTVRYPADLPERVRRAGGTFQIGPNNTIQIRSGNQHQNITFGTGNQPNTPVVLQHQTPSFGPTWRMANVPSMDHKRFLTNLYLRREIDRLASFARWPTDRPNVPPAALAKSGFFYLGDMDRVQCFSCGGVLRNWTLEDSAEDQHRIHFGGCRMILRTETRNIPVPDTDESDQVLANNYPLRFPSNPHMRGQAQRESTFDRRWPAGRLNVSIEEIAAAGFFYLGERDRVKCYYCNGGLQNWEIDDKPWDEHAKWFPNCQFLLRMKGQRFVHHHLSRNAELGRPLIARQDGSPLDPMGVPQVGSRGRDIPPRETRPPTPPPTIIDPQEEMRKRKERVKNVLKNSEVVKNVLAMGFAENIVEPLLEDRILSDNVADPDNIYGSVSELLDEVMKKEAEMKQEEEQRRNQANSMVSNQSEYSPMSSLSTLGSLAPGSGKYNVSYFGEDEDMNDIDMYGSMEGASNQEETKEKQLASVEGTTESLQKQLDKIEEERMCKICFSNVADMLFSPCSHMVCCMECTQAIKHCPVCRKRIEKALKTYFN